MPFLVLCLVSCFPKMKQTIHITTDAVIFGKVKIDFYILLIQRKNAPFQNKWALPGGFVEENEKLIKACQRELHEETGLQIEIQEFTFVDVFDALQRDPRSRTISVAYTCVIDKLPILEANDDAANARWIKLENAKELAFDHEQIIAKAKSVLDIH